MPATIIAANRMHLDVLVLEHLNKHGMRADLNHIDVSAIQDFDMLFASKPFNGDVSLWNMSNALTMRGMFTNSAFEGDLSNWDVSKVIKMPMLFAESPFNGDISRWDVRQVLELSHAFEDCPFDGDLSGWSLNPDVETAFCFAQRSDFPERHNLRLPIVPIRQDMEAFFGYDSENYEAWLSQEPGINHWRVLIGITNALADNQRRADSGKSVVQWASMDLDNWPHPHMIAQWRDARAVHEGLGMGMLESATTMHRLAQPVQSLALPTDLGLVLP